MDEELTDEQRKTKAEAEEEAALAKAEEEALQAEQRLAALAELQKQNATDVNKVAEQRRVRLAALQARKAAADSGAELLAGEAGLEDYLADDKAAKAAKAAQDREIQAKEKLAMRKRNFDESVPADVKLRVQQRWDMKMEVQQHLSTFEWMEGQQAKEATDRHTNHMADSQARRDELTAVLKKLDVEDTESLTTMREKHRDLSGDFCIDVVVKYYEMLIGHTRDGDKLVGGAGIKPTAFKGKGDVRMWIQGMLRYCAMCRFTAMQASETLTLNVEEPMRTTIEMVRRTKPFEHLYFTVHAMLEASGDALRDRKAEALSSLTNGVKQEKGQDLHQFAAIVRATLAEAGLPNEQQRGQYAVDVFCSGLHDKQLGEMSRSDANHSPILLLSTCVLFASNHQTHLQRMKAAGSKGPTFTAAAALGEGQGQGRQHNTHRGDRGGRRGRGGRADHTMGGRGTPPQMLRNAGVGALAYNFAANPRWSEHAVPEDQMHKKPRMDAPAGVGAGRGAAGGGYRGPTAGAGAGYQREPRACFKCGSLEHLSFQCRGAPPK